MHSSLLSVLRGGILQGMGEYFTQGKHFAAAQGGILLLLKDSSCENVCPGTEAAEHH